jgi:ketosteroid isomerase-like protein
MRSFPHVRRGTIALALLLMSSPLAAQSEPARSGRVLEVRSYNLKPGTRRHFHQLFLREALPMLHRWKVDVVAYGPSMHDDDSYYLMRAYASVGERQRSEDAFYGSDEWKSGPREAILADIDTYATIVIHVDERTLQGLRGRTQATSGKEEGAMQVKTDLTTLIELNRDYVDSVQKSDVRRFKAMLADDFLCSLPDGSLLDRDRFLEYTARPVTISGLEAHDVDVRLMGDFAIIHARTTFTMADGGAGAGRYTDVWARRNGTWQAVSAHVTRLP